MFDKLVKIEDRMRDLGHGLNRQYLLEGGDNPLLLLLVQFQPAGEECSVKEFPAERNKSMLSYRQRLCIYALWRANIIYANKSFREIRTP